MPSYVTHTLFGMEVRQHLFQLYDIDIVDIINKNPVAFQWGTQGPDILFFKNGFRRAPNPLGDFGAKMHKTKNAQLFETMRQYLVAHPEDNGAKAYVFGFVCHYYLDRAVHPYVYFMQEKMRNTYDSSLPYGIHMKLETDMDTAMYREKVGGNIRKFHLDDTLITSDEQLNAVGRIQSSVVASLYGGEYPVEDYVMCMKNGFKKEKFMFDPTFFKSYLFCRFLEITRGEIHSQSANCRPKEVDYDILNTSKATWCNFRKKTEVTTQSVVELFDEAAKEGAEFIQKLYKCVVDDQPLGLSEDIPTFDDGNPDVFGMDHTIISTRRGGW